MTGDAKAGGRSPEQWLSLATLFVAPTSLITGLCYFFGLLAIRHRLQYFGVDPSALGYSSADYVVATIGVFFFAALRALVVCAALLLLAVGVRQWAASGRRITLLRALAWTMLTFGGLALGAAAIWLMTEYPVIDVVFHHVIRDGGPVYTAWAIVIGVGALAAGYRVLSITGGIRSGHRLPTTAERGLLAVAVAGLVVALFWITDIYAAEFGDRKGAFASSRLWASDGPYTAVQLDTNEALNLPADLVRTSALPGAAPGSAPTYRYECLRVLEVHGGRYILVPAKWQRDRGYAITVTPDAGHRINTIVRAAPTGKDANVSPYWQCPEVVGTYQESDLGPMLIGAEEAQSIVSGEALTSRPSAVRLETSSAEGCAASLPPYPKEGTTAQQSESTGTSLWLRQRTTAFPDAISAANFMVVAQSHWTDCAGSTVAVHRSGAPQARVVSAPGTQEDILAVTDSAPGSSLADCAIAIAAKSNVVIQVDLCGADQPLMAVAVAAAIRNRIPT